MQEKSLIKKNILFYLENKGISKYKFYQDTGITRGVLGQNNGMSEENTAKILAYYPEISTDWLLTGKGEMLRKTNSTKNTESSHIPTHIPEVTQRTNIEGKDKDKNPTGQEKTQENLPVIDRLLKQLEEKNKEIKDMSREIGRLETENRHLQTLLSEKNTAWEDAAEDVTRADAG